MTYKVKAIPAAICREVREKMISPQYRSLAAASSPATGYGPCRSCLRVFDQEKDRRIYFTYNAFEGRSELPDPGPVFIHENECEAFVGPGFPNELKDLPVLLESFDEGGAFLTRERLRPDAADGQIATIFANADVRHINLRNAEAGCFIATVERGT